MGMNEVKKYEKNKNMNFLTSFIRKESKNSKIP